MDAAFNLFPWKTNFQSEAGGYPVPENFSQNLLDITLINT